MDYTPFIQVARERSSNDPAHDFLHVMRVLKNAQIIVRDVPADSEVIVPAILLHEIFNYPKENPLSQFSGDICAEHASEVLESLNFPNDKRERVLDCIGCHSFSKGVIPKSIEGKIVQDADRLDAIGAIGIARLFATCVEMKTVFYDSTDPFADNRELNDKRYGLDHFYTKLNKLAAGMHTKTAKELAMKRTEFMHGYIQQLRSEMMS